MILEKAVFALKTSRSGWQQSSTFAAANRLSTEVRRRRARRRSW